MYNTTGKCKILKYIGDLIISIFMVGNEAAKRMHVKFSKIELN